MCLFVSVLTGKFILYVDSLGLISPSEILTRIEQKPEFTLPLLHSSLPLFFIFPCPQDWERDMDYTLSDMLVFDGNGIVMDTAVFFVVGRLHQKRGVDHAAFVMIALSAATYTSWSYTFRFLQHSVTLYEMHCRWPWQLWVFLLLVLVLSVFVVERHATELYRQCRLGQKLTEMVLATLLFLAPQAWHPFFHFHHWLAGWFIGMHANLDTWWSAATMAWCWGQYLNGVAVYGRDPQLTCAYGYFVSVDQGCSYLDCYRHQVTDAITNETETVYEAMPQPDWRNCSNPYHP